MVDYIDNLKVQSNSSRIHDKGSRHAYLNSNSILVGIYSDKAYYCGLTKVLKCSLVMQIR